MTHLYARLRIAIALAGYKSIAQWAEERNMKLSNVLRVVKGKIEKGRTKPPTSPGYVLRIEDFIRDQFSKHPDILSLGDQK